MAQILDVIFENGVFRPLVPVGIKEGKRLRIRMESEIKDSPDDVLALAADVFNGLSDEEQDAVEQIATNRADFFKDRAV